MKVLFLPLYRRGTSKGPPPARPNWFWIYFGLLAANVLRASSVSLRRNSHRVTWYSLVPDLVTMFTCTGLRPFSALKFEVETLNSAMVSGLGMDVEPSSHTAFEATPSTRNSV